MSQKKSPTPQRKETSLTKVQGQVLSYSSPFPPPEILEKYNAIHPGLAERTITLIEQQSKHRQELENIVVKSGSRDSKWGIICAFITSVLGIVGGVICVLKGHDGAGGTITSICLTSLVGTFVYGTSSRRKEREEKAKNMLPQ
ncbi:DUF2335 domain-containing protein [bacterium]|nr:DUF2335 domain-containing protein [bacterium]